MGRVSDVVTLGTPHLGSWFAVSADHASRTLDLQYYAIHADASTEVLLQRLREAARREIPEASRDQRLLSVISGYRSPAENDARCM